MSHYSIRAFALASVCILVSIAAATGGLAGQDAPEAQFDRSAAFRGELTYNTYCASCHGKEANGDGPLAKELKVKPANLAELSSRHDGEFPFDMVVETIDHGRSVRGHGTEDMPAWGDAFKMTSQTEAEAKDKINELAHYLWSIQAE